MYDFYANQRAPLPNSRQARKILLIMKITTLILITAILHVSATTLAQKVTLNEKNAPLVDVFNDISAQTNFDFAFTTDALKNAKTVTIHVQNGELSDVLTQILQGEDLEFSIENNSVVIKPKDPSFLDNLKNKIKAEMAQVTITGQVVDGTGQPISGVNVIEKGTSNGTQTDQKGNFKLSAAADNSIVTFSFIGYETQEVAAKYILAGSVITLKPTSENLREVVVNKGYYNEKQKLSTGDVSIVTAKEIEEQPVSDPIQALEGRVAGLQITQTSGMPGSYAKIQINGQNSIANGNNPFYIVDGVPFSSTTLTSTTLGGGALGAPISSPVNYGTGLSPFNALNPDDIESIEVLKDADATAIYGSRGANGVILITTKKGKAGNTKVDVDLSQGDGQVTRTMDLLNTQQYLQIRRQAYANDGITTIPANAYDLNGTWDPTRYTNWQKVLLGNTAHYTNAQLAVSGGNENTQFYIGGGFNRQTTVFPGDFDDAKGSLNFSLTHSSADKRFQLTLSAGYVNDNNNLPTVDVTSQALTLAPDAPALYNANGSLNWQLVGGTATWSNPLYATLRNANAVTNNLISNLQLSYLILPGLHIKSSFGYNDDRMNQTIQTPASSYAPPNNTNAADRSNNFGTAEFSTWIIEPQISYDKKIAKGTLSVLVGSTIQQNVSNAFSEGTSGYTSDALIANPLNASTKSLGGYNNTLYRYNAVYGRIGYTWDDEYLLNVTARRDGSSRFGPATQWGNFGAVGAGWIFTREQVIKDNLPWLSYGKLRGSYGITGNDQITDYQYLSTYSTNSPTYEGTTGLYPTRIANPNYGWEVDKKLEGGLELGFLNDRINLSADYYRERSANQLVAYPLPLITGFTSVEENLPAVVQNTATEFTLNTINIKSPNFKWSSSFNLTIPHNELVSYPGLACSTYRNTYVIGQPLSITEVYHFLGVNPATGVDQYASSTGPTDNAATTDKIPVFVGQKFYGGLQNSFQYKNFQLDVFFQFVKQTGLNYNKVAGGSQELGLENFNEPTAYLNYWKKPGDIVPYGAPSTNYGSDPYGDYYRSDAIVSNASYIRLKNLALSYTLPKSWQQAMHLQNARIYMQAQNLLTFTNYFGLDPETGPNGLPPLRMITLGIHVSL
jgi:TonB-linked SusC/RagA family outer membrane protein